MSFVACNKDKSTIGAPLPVANVTGLKDTLTVYSHRDTLKLNPIVENESSYDYYWTLFNSSYSPGQGLVLADTIGRTKSLSYIVLKDPGAYILVFNVKDKKTGVNKQFNTVLNISTLTMNGWYLVKDNNGKTDMDFIYPTGRIDNWISNFNGGQSLDGNAVKGIYVSQLKTSPTATTTFNGIMVTSTNDAGIYRVDNGAKFLGFDSMFFTTPTTRKLQNIFQPAASINLGLINNGVAYSMVKGTRFTILPSVFNNVSYNQLSPLVGTAAMDIGFNPISKSVFCYNGASFSALNANYGKDLTNMDAKPKWFTGYAGRSIALLLFNSTRTDSGYLFKLDGTYGPLAGFSGPLILVRDTLAPSHGLLRADKICGHYDVDIIYYSVGNNIYATDVASLQEKPQFSVPLDETITCIQYVKYPDPMIAKPSKIDYVAVATYKAGRYKVYLCTVSSTGTLQSPSQPNFEGVGRVANLFYMEQGIGSRVY